MTYTDQHGLTAADVAHLKAGEPAELVFEMDGRRQRVLADELIVWGRGLMTPLGDVVLHNNGDPSDFLVEVVSPKPPARPDGVYQLTNPKDGTIHYVQSFEGKWGTQHGSTFAFTNTEYAGWTVGPRFVPEGGTVFPMTDRAYYAAFHGGDDAHP